MIVNLKTQNVIMENDNNTSKTNNENIVNENNNNEKFKNEEESNNIIVHKKDVSKEEIDSIEYDIYIEKIELIKEFLYTPVTTNEYRLINIKKKELYIIKSLYNSETKESNISYSMKYLTDSQIEKVKVLCNKGSIKYWEYPSQYYIVKTTNATMELIKLPFEDDLW